MFRVLCLLCVLILFSVPAKSDVPDVNCSSTTLDESGVLLLVPDEDGADPHPLGTFSVIVRGLDCDDLLANAVVEVLIAGQDEGRIRLCSSAITTKTTDENGYVEFNIPGGGCLRSDGSWPDAVRIRVNGVIIRVFHVVSSPDYAGTDNEGIPNRWSLSIDPIDLAAFAAAYQGGIGPASCHDYNNDGTVSPEDLAVFVAVWAGGTRDCSP